MARRLTGATDEERLKREGAADAVLKIVAAKTLLSPFVRADDLLAVLGLTRAELQAALDRRRASHVAASRGKRPERRWEVFDRRAPRWTVVDELVYEAVTELGTAGPTQIELYLRHRGEAIPYSTVSMSLHKQLCLGRLVKPRHGHYRIAA